MIWKKASAAEGRIGFLWGRGFFVVTEQVCDIMENNLANIFAWMIFMLDV